MNMEEINWMRQLAIVVIEYTAITLFVLLLVGVVALIRMYITDVTQTQQAVRRNYPVIGRFRYLFEHLGGFFRQYFYAQDREELPFNRAYRSWVYRASKNIDTTIAFGSTQPLNHPGDVIFLNAFLPVMKHDAVANDTICLGEGVARLPYTTRSVVNISAMSFGAISEPAVRALSRGAKAAGIWLNTGEGGLTPFHLEGGCDLVFQIGTAKYGVRDQHGKLCHDRLKAVAAHPQVRMFEIKMSQGAKPGKGGLLPGGKVTEEVAIIRGIPAGLDSVSPNGHEEIHSVGDLLDMIEQVRDVTGKPTGFKVVMGDSRWVDDLLQEIHRRGTACAPDFITLDSADGGTGAAPQSLMDSVGLPLQRSLPLLVDKLGEYGLRKRIKVIASGKLITPCNIAWAMATGADFVNTARGFMFALGCIQALQCNKNTCPAGITTHDKDLQQGLVPEDKARRVENYVTNLLREVNVLANSCGVKHLRLLQRGHVQLINDRGLPEAMDSLFPEVRVRKEYAGLENSQVN
jgi:glutamate synthase domain-containing protein 2